MSEVRIIYRRRNELFKGGGDMSVSVEELTKIASLAHDILDYELENN